MGHEHKVLIREARAVSHHIATLRDVTLKRPKIRVRHGKITLVIRDIFRACSVHLRHDGKVAPY